jgi:hypothetical protein
MDCFYVVLYDNDILSNTWLRIITEENAQRLALQALGHHQPPSDYFNRKSQNAFKRRLAQPWPSRLQPRVGPPLALT